jgi:hypothetical protein
MVVKVVHDMLTKKWIFIRKDKQLEDPALKSFRASIFEAFKNLSEMAMFIEAMRKTIELTEKMKKKAS